MTDADLVVISFVNPSLPNRRVYHLLFRDTAREMWQAISAPLRETAIIKDAEPHDIGRGERSWEERV